MIWKYLHESPPPPPPPPPPPKTSSHSRKERLQNGLRSMDSSHSTQDDKLVLSLHDSWSTFFTKDGDDNEMRYYDSQMKLPKDASSTLFSHTATFHSMMGDQNSSSTAQQQQQQQQQPSNQQPTFRNNEEPSLLVQQMSNYTTPSFLKASASSQQQQQQEKPAPTQNAMKNRHPHLLHQLESSSLLADTTLLGGESSTLYGDTSTFHTAADRTFQTAQDQQSSSLLQSSLQPSSVQDSHLSSVEKAQKLAQLYVVGSTEQQEQYLQFCDKSEIAMAIQLLEQMSSSKEQATNKNDDNATNYSKSSRRSKNSCTKQNSNSKQKTKKPTVEPVSHEHGMTLVANVGMESSLPDRNNMNPPVSSPLPTVISSSPRHWKRQDALNRSMVNASSSSLSSSSLEESTMIGSIGNNHNGQRSSMKDHLPASFAPLFACAENTTSPEQNTCTSAVNDSAKSVMTAAQRLPFADQTATCCNKVKDVSVETWKTQSVRAQQLSRKLQLQMQNLRASHQQYTNSTASSNTEDISGNYPKPSAAALTRQPTPAQLATKPKRVMQPGAYGSFEDGGQSNGYTTFEV